MVAPAARPRAVTPPPSRNANRHVCPGAPHRGGQPYSPALNRLATVVRRLDLGNGNPTYNIGQLGLPAN